MSGEGTLRESGNPEVEFVRHMRLLTQQYLRSVDAWEAAYSKCFRLVVPDQISSDLAPQQREYERAHRELQRSVPQARRMCWRYGVRDPWDTVLRIRLGANSPQAGIASAIGKGERNLVAVCLAELEEAAWKPAESATDARLEPAVQEGPRGIVRRVVDFFF